MKIYDVISLAYFEPVIDPRNDPHHRHRTFPPAVIMNGQKNWKIEKWMQKRQIQRNKKWSVQYLTRWLKYGPEYNQWISEHRFNNVQELINDYKKAFGQTLKVTSPPMFPSTFPQTFPTRMQFWMFRQQITVIIFPRPDTVFSPAIIH